MEICRFLGASEKLVLAFGVRHILSNSSTVSSRLGNLLQLPPALLVPWLLSPVLLDAWLLISFLLKTSLMNNLVDFFVFEVFVQRLIEYIFKLVLFVLNRHI